MKTYRAAIVGLGRIGSEFDPWPIHSVALSHAGAYTIHPRTSLVAGCDQSPDKLDAFKQKWQTAALYSDFKELLKKEQLDVLSVCTPVETHSAIVREACRYPLRAIYCEKPISNDLKSAKEMIQACRRKGILLMVNHQRRFDPFFRELKEKISAGFIGQIQQVNCYYTRGILNTGIHLLDLFGFLFGKANGVMATISNNKSPFKDDPNLDVLIRFQDGVNVTMKACDDRHFLILEIDIIGSQGRIRLGKQLEVFQVRAGNNLLKRNELIGPVASAFKESYGTIDLKNGVEHMIRCLEKKDNLSSTGEDALSAITLYEKIMLSAKKEAPVKIG